MLVLSLFRLGGYLGGWRRYCDGERLEDRNSPLLNVAAQPRLGCHQAHTIQRHTTHTHTFTTRIPYQYGAEKRAIKHHKNRQEGVALDSVSNEKERRKKQKTERRMGRVQGIISSDLSFGLPCRALSILLLIIIPP